MAPRSKVLISLTIAFALIAGACGSEPESVIVGDADGSDQVASEPSISDAEPDDSSTSPYEGPTSIDDLLGTSWVIQTLDGAPYLDAGGLTFFVSNGSHSSMLQVAFNDVCSAGGGDLDLEGRLDGDVYVLEPWAPIATECQGHPAAVFSGDDVELSISISAGVLSITGPAGQLTATHFQSVSVHDDLLELPSVPAPDVPAPASSDPTDIAEATEIALPLCGDLDHASIDDFGDIDSDVFATMVRLYVVTDELPFVEQVNVDEYAAGGVVAIQMSARYQPTIDWLSEVIGSTPACLVFRGDPGEADAGADQGDMVTTTTTAQG